MDCIPAFTDLWRNTMTQKSRRLLLTTLLLACLCLTGMITAPFTRARAASLPAAAHDNPIAVGGLFADQGPLFDNQLEPACTIPVTVKIRAYHNDLTSANLVYYDTASSSTLTVSMSVTSQDATGVYDFWQGTIPASCSIKYYRFELIDGTATEWYNAAGASSNEPSSNDFYVLPGYSVPAWARTGVMYQIFPDRFYNGDSGNDVATGAYTYNGYSTRSEEHTSELQSRQYLVCRLLLEKKKNRRKNHR